jgi:hypothetical protein
MTMAAEFQGGRLSAHPAALIGDHRSSLKASAHQSRSLCDKPTHHAGTTAHDKYRGKPGRRAVKQWQIRRRQRPGLRAIDKLPVVDRPAWSHMAQLALPRPYSSAGVFPARNTEYLYALGLRVIEVCEF